jgi:predicted nucleotidyltransferase
MLMDAIPLTLKCLFSSKLRIKILSHFFFHPGESYHVRRLASVLGEPVGALGRELKNLENAGILASRAVGNQKHYSPRQDSPIHDELRSIFLKTSGASAALRAVLENQSGIEIAFVYGSYASGEAHASSDIDLMVIGDITDRKLAPAVARVERHLGREINYSLYARSEVDKRVGKKGDYVHEVLSGPKIMLIGSGDDGLFSAN